MSKVNKISINRLVKGPQPKTVKFIFTRLLLIWVLTVSLAEAADKQGQYAVRGVGLVSCKLFISEKAARGDVYLMTAAWVDGYISGTNQHADNTYDVLSFESTELLMNVLEKHCKQYPDDPVFGVVASLFKKLQSDRLVSYSEKITIEEGKRNAQLYKEVVQRLQNALKDKGYYSGPANGSFTGETQAAVAKFQKSIEFEATGFPDQLTLWRLMRKDN